MRRLKTTEKVLIYKAAFITLLVLMLPSGPVAAQCPPEVGGLLPEMNLTIPTEPKQRSYLGLTGEGSFKIPQIKAKVVIIEIFSMYCPHCQREASRVNELYQLVEENSNLKGRLKLLGIGAGNSSFEVSVFRKRYKVPFPLFPDRDFIIHKSLGEVRTPYFIGVKISNNGDHEVFYSKLGGFEKADDFLRLMVELSGLK